MYIGTRNSLFWTIEPSKNNHLTVQSVVGELAMEPHALATIKNEQRNFGSLLN